MRFDSEGRVSEVTWYMKLADIPRSANRAALNILYNGHPPWSEEKAEENGVQINYSSLEGPNLLSQARRSWNNAFLKAGNYYKVSLDSGPIYKRRDWSASITTNWNRALKRSAAYMEYKRGMGGTVMLHGPSPANWDSRKSPYPRQIAVDDLLIPSDTNLDFDNLDHFAIFRQWTPSQLYRLTHGPKIDKGWNMPLVKAQLQYAATQYTKEAYSLAYQYQPEKIEELIKQDGGFWGSDATPTIDVWDFFFREEDDGDGWYRRIVLDTPISNEARANYLNNRSRPGFEPKGGFLYTSEKRAYASSLRQILHCQFADCSAVFPAKYHSVRSLGLLLYGVCQIQDRLRCRFSESVFEQLMWFFRTSNEQQFERLKKAIFTHMGVIPEGISFVTATERFKPDHNLINLALSQNRQLMSENAASFTSEIDKGTQKEMTATETMARVNQVNALVGGMLNLAYEYEKFEGRETARRFCIKDSQHPDVKKFRLECLKGGVPEEYLDADRWDIEPERVLGGGNKTLEIAQAEKLQAMRAVLSPEAQQVVDHVAIEAYTDDPALAESLVPLSKRDRVSDAKHDAMLAVGTLMLGSPVLFTEDQNPIDLVETLLGQLIILVQKFVQRGGMPAPDQVEGLINIVKHIKPLIARIAENKEEKARVKRYSDLLGKQENEIKGFVQRLQEQAQQRNGQGAGMDPKDQAKIQGMQITAQAKAANARESHAQRTAQRQVQFEMEEKRKEQQHQLEMRREVQKQQVEDTATDLKTAAEIKRGRMKSFSE